jgi:NADH-quinone oxidoreductase subunit M
VLLGLATLNTIGLSGAVLQMFSHGIIAGLLFAVVGRMVYDRTHTRDFNGLQTMQLGHLLPFAGVTFVLAGVASMGMPGFSGFVAELQVLMGAWKVFPKTTMLAGVGIVVGVAYILRAVQKAFYSDATPGKSGHDHPLEPISVPERVGAVMLIAASLVIGLFPGLLLDWIQPCLNSPTSMFARLLNGGGL